MHGFKWIKKLVQMKYCLNFFRLHERIRFVQLIRIDLVCTDWFGLIFDLFALNFSGMHGMKWIKKWVLMAFCLNFFGFYGLIRFKKLKEIDLVCISSDCSDWFGLKSLFGSISDLNGLNFSGMHKLKWIQKLIGFNGIVQIEKPFWMDFG